jgi:hypothetical protein
MTDAFLQKTHEAAVRLESADGDNTPTNHNVRNSGAKQDHVSLNMAPRGGWTNSQRGGHSQQQQNARARGGPSRGRGRGRGNQGNRRADREEARNARFERRDTDPFQMLNDAISEDYTDEERAIIMAAARKEASGPAMRPNAAQAAATAAGDPTEAKINMPGSIHHQAKMRCDVVQDDGELRAGKEKPAFDGAKGQESSDTPSPPPVPTLTHHTNTTYRPAIYVVDSGTGPQSLEADQRCVSIIESVIVGLPLAGAGLPATLKLALNRSRGVHTTLVDIPLDRVSTSITNSVIVAMSNAVAANARTAELCYNLSPNRALAKRVDRLHTLNGLFSYKLKVIAAIIKHILAGVPTHENMTAGFWHPRFTTDRNRLGMGMSAATFLAGAQHAVRKVGWAARLVGVAVCAIGLWAWISSVRPRKLPYDHLNWELLQTLSQTYNEKHCCPGVSHPLLIDEFVAYKKESVVVPDSKLPIIVGDLSQTDTLEQVEHLAVPVFSQYIPSWPRMTSSAMLKGVQERMFGGLPSEADANNAHASWLKGFLDEELGMRLYPCERCHQFGTHEACFEAWNASQGSEARVSPFVANLHEEAKEANHCGIHDESVKVFTKNEPSMNCTDGAVDQEPLVPRCICNVSQQYHTAIGPVTYARSKALSRIWNADNWLYYVSGDTAAKVAATLEYGRTYYVGDVSRFDRGLSYTMLKQLNAWWGQYHISSLERKALLAQLETRAYTQKGFHRFKFKGMRRSGDDNTSVDNTLLNIATHVWAIVLHTQKSVSELRKVLKIMALGDDIVIQGPAWLGDVDFKKLLAPLGWAIKPKHTTDLDRVEFCSRLAWPSQHGRVFGGKIARSLVRFGWNSQRNAVVDPGEKAYGMLLDNSHVPFLRLYLQRVVDICGVKLSTKFRIRREWAMSSEQKFVVYEPVSETYTMLTNIYGLTRDDEDSFYEALQEWHGGQAVMWHPAITLLLQGEGLL